MTTEDKGKYWVISPNKGMMLYNGETISDGLFVPKTADLSAWREITIAEAEAIQQELEKAEMDERENFE